MSDMPDYHMYVVPVNVAVPPGQVSVGDVAEYDSDPEDIADGSRGPILIDQKGRVWIRVYSGTVTVEQSDQTKLKATVYQADNERTVDHTKIKGVALKDPAVAAAIPTSIENEAIAYDAANDLFKVAVYYDAGSIDPRDIRSLTSGDVVTVVQDTPGSHLIRVYGNTVKDGSGTDYAFLVDADGKVIISPLSSATSSIKVLQDTPGDLKATVTQAEKDRTVTGTVTVEQATAANLKATVTQAEKDRTVTGTVTAQQATAANLKAEVSQPTAASLKATVTQAEKDREISDITKTASVATGEATSSGNTEIITVAAGKKLRIKGITIWNNGTASLVVALRFTSTGTLTYKHKIAAESGWIKNLIGCNWEGAVDADLFINLSDTGTVSYTIDYVEV